MNIEKIRESITKKEAELRASKERERRQRTKTLIELGAALAPIIPWDSADAVDRVRGLVAFARQAGFSTGSVPLKSPSPAPADDLILEDVE